MVTSSIGVWPSLIASILVCAFVLFTGLMLLEVVAAQPPGVNLPTITKKYFGRVGSIFSSLTFLIVHYSYLIFYIFIGSTVLSPLIAHHTGWNLSPVHLFLILAAYIWLIILMGSRFLMALNGLLVCGLLGTLITLFFQGSPDLFVGGFVHTGWVFFFLGVAELYDIFFFQSAIPTVFNWLRGDKFKAKIAIWVGATLPFVLYWLWLWLVVTPQDEMRFIEVFNRPGRVDRNSSIPTYLGGGGIDLVFIWGLLSGTISAGLVVYDFFADLFHTVSKKISLIKRAGIALLIVIPSALLSFAPKETIGKFIDATEGFGEVILGAFIPILCIWSMHYLHHKNCSKSFSGKKVLIVSLLAALFFFYIEGINLLGLTAW